jgi:hypothetical protein
MSDHHESKLKVGTFSSFKMYSELEKCFFLSLVCLKSLTQHKTDFY